MNDPAIIGPGIWVTIHLLAISGDREQFVKFMDFLKYTFPCIVCRNHISKYLDCNPIPVKTESNNELFRWSWKFHNTVNIRLGKSFMGWNNAYTLYKTTGY